MERDTSAVTLHLGHVRDLFDEPEFDPFAPHHNFVPGIDQIISALSVGSLLARSKVVIVLPRDQLVPDLDARVRAAIAQYCRFRIRENDREMASLRWDGIKSLVYSLITLVACWFLSFLAGQAGETGLLSKGLSYFLSEGFLLIGWVSLWHPVETFLYGWWPHVRQNQVLRHLAERTDVVLGGDA